MDEDRGRVMPPWMRESSMLKPSMRPSMLGLALPLGLQSSSGNPFNLAKARADAAAASTTGSRASSYRSRRQSVGSQMSHMSYSSKRSMRSGKSGRYGRSGKSFKTVEIVEPDIVQVFDEHGNDVTPKPLVLLRATALHERLLQIPTDRFTPESERPSLYSRYSMASSMGSFTPDTLDIEGAEREEGDASMMRWGVGAVLSKDSTSHHVENQRRIHLVHSRVFVPTTEKDRERSISVTIVESETFEVLNLRGHTLNNTYENVKDVLEKNSRYKKLLQLKVGSDNYSDSNAQTLFSLRKTKEVQVSAKPTEEDACQANSWDMSDSYLKKKQAGKSEIAEAENKDSFMQRGITTEAAEDARIAELLVSAGYLESSTSITSAATLSSNLAQRITAGSIGGSRRGTLLGNAAASKRGSVFGAFVGSRRGSTMGSVPASKRESVSGSVGGSRRGSTSGSLAPSRRGSTMGNISLSRRGSKAGVLVEDPLLARGSFMERRSGGAEDGTDALIIAEDSSVPQKKDVDLRKIVGLVKALEIAERALAQNTLHDKLVSTVEMLQYMM